MEPDQIKELVVSELKTALSQFKTKNEEFLKQLNELKSEIEECKRFNTRLIAALQKAEKETDTYLLPQGEFHGVKID